MTDEDRYYLEGLFIGEQLGLPDIPEDDEGESTQDLTIPIR